MLFFDHFLMARLVIWPPQKLTQGRCQHVVTSGRNRFSVKRMPTWRTRLQVVQSHFNVFLNVPNTECSTHQFLQVPGTPAAHEDAFTNICDRNFWKGSCMMLQNVEKKKKPKKRRKCVWLILKDLKSKVLGN